MRIIAGRFKRRVLRTSEGAAVTRPTSDKVRGAVFNILGQDLSDFTVLDLFAGSGALGLEALSRGASRCVFVEENDLALQMLRENIAALGLSPDEAIVVPLRVEAFLGNPKGYLGRTWDAIQRGCDVVFADPPYKSTWYDEALEHLHASGLCAADCDLVLEMDSGRNLSGTFPGWEQGDARVWGKTRVEFWQYLEP